jgi:hypothetical protein
LVLNRLQAKKKTGSNNTTQGTIHSPLRAHLVIYHIQALSEEQQRNQEEKGYRNGHITSTFHSFNKIKIMPSLNNMGRKAYNTRKKVL